MKRLADLILFLLLALLSSWPVQSLAQQEAAPAKQLHLDRAVMCESIHELDPVNPAIAFSNALGKISCYTYFDSVPDKMFVYHHWYFRDKSSAKIKLFLQPPAWRTFSTIQLRDADKGPWRVEVLGPDGTVLDVLRFSITD